MNILITGLHGFVGTNLVKALAPKHTIYGVDIIAPEKEGVVRTYSWEDLDEGKVPAADVVIHLAGKAHDTKNEAKAEVYFEGGGVFRGQYWTDGEDIRLVQAVGKREVRVFQYGEGGG